MTWEERFHWMLFEIRVVAVVSWTRVLLYISLFSFHSLYSIVLRPDNLEWHINGTDSISLPISIKWKTCYLPVWMGRYVVYIMKVIFGFSEICATLPAKTYHAKLPLHFYCSRCKKGALCCKSLQKYVILCRYLCGSCDCHAFSIKEKWVWKTSFEG